MSDASALNQAKVSKRIFSLDVLRGVAISAVLIRHCPGRIASDSDPAAFVFRALQIVGWVGVDLFFVLSGFLISGLLFSEIDKTGSLRVSRFLLRRGFKIWPSYFVCYGLLVVLWQLAPATLAESRPPSTLVEHVPINAVFIQNYFPSEQRWSHSWSLAIEEHFYTLLPLALLLVLSTTRNRLRLTTVLPAALLSVCVICTALRCYMGATGATWETLYYRTHYRIDSLAFGVLICFCRRYRPEVLEPLRKHSLTVLAMIAVVCTGLLVWRLETHWFAATIGFTALYLLFGCLVALADMHPAFGTAGTPWTTVPCGTLAFLGVFSYTIYLAHSIVYKVPGIVSVRSLFDDHVWIDRSCFLALSIGGGLLLSYCVERPFLTLRTRWLSAPVDSRAAIRSDVAVAPAIDTLSAAQSEAR